MKTKVSTEWLSGCSGCHVAMVDLHEKLINILDDIEFVRIPVLMDEKGYPEADIGIVEGAVRSEHDREALLSMRKSVKKLIAFGTCAVYGGPSGIGWLYTKESIINRVYSEVITATAKEKLDGDVPHLEQSVVPIDEIVEVDIYLPGCPPHPFWVATALGALQTPEKHTLSQKTVCSLCERRMNKQTGVSLKPSDTTAPDDKLCLLCQGVICMGSVTMERCMSPCPNKGVACTGCAGPSFDIIVEPHLDIKNMIAKRMHLLTGIDIEKIKEHIEREAVTYYSYSLASPVIYKKPELNIKAWAGATESKQQ